MGNAFGTCETMYNVRYRKKLLLGGDMACFPECHNKSEDKVRWWYCLINKSKPRRVFPARPPPDNHLELSRTLGGNFSDLDSN